MFMRSSHSLTHDSRAPFFLDDLTWWNDDGISKSYQLPATNCVWIFPGLGRAIRRSSSTWSWSATGQSDTCCFTSWSMSRRLRYIFVVCCHAVAAVQLTDSWLNDWLMMVDDCWWTNGWLMIGWPLVNWAKPRCESQETQEEDLRELCRRYLFNSDGGCPRCSMQCADFEDFADCRPVLSRFAIVSRRSRKFISWLPSLAPASITVTNFILEDWLSVDCRLIIWPTDQPTNVT